MGEVKWAALICIVVLLMPLWIPMLLLRLAWSIAVVAFELIDAGAAGE